MTNTATPCESSTFPILIQLALKNKILSREQVDEALAQMADQHRKGNPVRVEDVLVQNRVISKDTLSRLVAASVRHLDKQFGLLAIQYGMVDKEYIVKALDTQKQAFAQGTLKTVGDILIEQGLLTIAQRDTLLEKLTVSDANNTAGQAPPSQARVPSQKDPIADERSKTGLTEPSPILILSDDDITAMVRIPGSLKNKPDRQTIKTLLSDEGVVFGIIPDPDIDAHLADSGQNPIEFMVAKGLPASPAKDALIKLYFTTQYLNPGKISENGVIDFRERGEVPFVQSGILLAEKIPGVDGKPGTNLFGQTLPATKAQDQHLKGGPGTRTADDGLTIFADQDGQPFITVHGEVSVFKELHIPGDVDYTTGNISFDGSIFVKGSIKPGFTVKGGNLTAREISGAAIDVKGNIDVSGGISDSTLTLGGILQAMFMTGSKVDAYGDVLIKKEIIDSKIRTSGACNGDQVTLISSFVSAREGIRVKRVGTDVSNPCTLRAGISDHTRKLIARLKGHIDEKKNHLETIQKKNEPLADLQRSLHQQTMEKTAMQGKISQQKTSITSKLKDVETYAADDPRHDKAVRFLHSAMDKCDSEIRLIDEQIADLLNQQDKVAQEILGLENACEPLVEGIEELNIQIREIQRWEKTSRGRSLIQVSKDIYAQTSVSGPNSTLILKETRKNVSIRETRTSEDAHPGWEMAIEPN